LTERYGEDQPLGDFPVIAPNGAFVTMSVVNKKHLETGKTFPYVIINHRPRRVYYDAAERAYRLKMYSAAEIARGSFIASGDTSMIISEDAIILRYESIDISGVPRVANEFCHALYAKIERTGLARKVRITIEEMR